MFIASDDFLPSSDSLVQKLSVQANFLSKFVGYLLVISCVFNPYSGKNGEVSLNHTEWMDVNVEYVFFCYYADEGACSTKKKREGTIHTLLQPKVRDAFGNYDLSSFQAE